MDIRGRNGLALTDKWADGPMSYLGLQTAEFPNLLMITGPGATLGNLPLSIETHVDWITDCVAHLRANGLRTVETTADAEKSWSDDVNEEAERSVIRLADSWYTGANIPGKPRSYFFYFGHFGRYRSRLTDIARSGYDGFVLS
jgi:cyclohexanone monooxygenase